MRLSVIIPGYNTPDALWTRCVQSVVAACGPEDEIICVDDGSERRPEVGEDEGRGQRLRLTEDGSRSDCGTGPRRGVNGRAASMMPPHGDESGARGDRALPKNDNSTDRLNLQPQPHIKWLYREKNGGLSEARNSGLAVAQGEYVTFVDSDDEVKPEVFSRCIKKLQNTNNDICLYGVDVIWHQDGIRKHDIPQDADYGVLDAATVEKLYYGCLFNYSCNKVYRKSFLNAHNLRFNSDGMPCEDIIFNLNCLMAGAKWCSVAYEGYVYYRSGSTQTSNFLASYAKGTKLAADTWAKYCAMDDDAAKCFKQFAELSDVQLLRLTWDNLWWRKSPYSLAGRYAWLKEHAKEMDVSNVAVEFLKKMVYFNLRKILYIHPVRIWHLKRVFPNIEKLK